MAVASINPGTRWWVARRGEDMRAKEAVELFCYQAKKFIGAYAAAMGGLNTLVFSAGIGEHAVEVRAQICHNLEWLGLELDGVLNAAHVNGREGAISREGSRLAAYVIPTDEELLIARDTVRCVGGVQSRY